MGDCIDDRDDVGRHQTLATRVGWWPTLALRAEETPAGLLVSGLAAPYGEEILYDGVRERIAPAAFAAVLEEGRDVLALLDHNIHNLLGRVSAGTLRLRDTRAGLAFQLWLRDTPAGREIYEQVRRREFGGVSVGFNAPASQYRDDNGLRTWVDLALLEISLITPFSAYKQTWVGVGQLPSERGEVRDWLAYRIWAT